MNIHTRLVIVVVVLFTLACISKKKNKEVLLQDFIEQHGFNYTELSSVLVITERGCPQCNASFAKLMREQQNNSDMLYVLSAKGTLVDISDLFDFNKVIEDAENSFKQLGITNQSACIFLTERGTIDTLIEIEAKNLEQSLQYVTSRLEH